MDKNDLESKKLPELRDLAKMLGIEGTETFKKPELIEAIAGDSNSNDSDDSPKRKRTRKKVMTDSKETAKEEVKPQTSLFTDSADKAEKVEAKAETKVETEKVEKVEKPEKAERPALKKKPVHAKQAGRQLQEIAKEASAESKDETSETSTEVKADGSTEDSVEKNQKPASKVPVHNHPKNPNQNKAANNQNANNNNPNQKPTKRFEAYERGRRNVQSCWNCFCRRCFGSYARWIRFLEIFGLQLPVFS